MATDPTKLATDRAAVIADLGAPASGQEALSQGEQVAVDLLTHAGKPGLQTSEFWALVLAPPVSFVGSLLATHALALGLATPPTIEAIIPPAVASITAALATLAARAYAIGRTDLKRAALSIHL